MSALAYLARYTNKISIEDQDHGRTQRPCVRALMMSRFCAVQGVSHTTEEASTGNEALSLAVGYQQQHRPIELLARYDGNRLARKPDELLISLALDHAEHLSIPLQIAHYLR